MMICNIKPVNQKNVPMAQKSIPFIFKARKIKVKAQNNVPMAHAPVNYFF